MNRKAKIAGLALIGVAAAGATLAMLLRKPRIVINRPARTYDDGLPSPQEFTLIELVAAKGWPTSDAETQFGTCNDVPFVIVRTTHGYAQLDLIDEQNFDVGRYTNTHDHTYTYGELPAILRDPNLSYQRFCAAVIGHNLNRARTV